MAAVAGRRDPIVATSDERVLVAEVKTMLSALGHPAQGPVLVAPDGSRAVLPDALYDVLLCAASDLAAGLAVVVLPSNAHLTTQQAADMLHVSRPTLIALLDDGRLPFTRARSHRRIELEDVLAFQRHHRAEADRVRARIVERAQELGVYDDFGPTAEP